MIVNLQVIVTILDDMTGITILIILGLLLLITAAAIGLTAFMRRKTGHRWSTYELPEKRAGRQGEQIVTQLIREVLEEEDTLLTNVIIHACGKDAELDNVVISSRGIFVIEAKNYVGELQGTEDDAEWTKYIMSPGGNLYTKMVKNPIKQVERQVHVLGEYLREQPS